MSGNVMNIVTLKVSRAVSFYSKKGHQKKRPLDGESAAAPEPSRKAVASVAPPPPGGASAAPAPKLAAIPPMKDLDSIFPEAGSDYVCALPSKRAGDGVGTALG